MTFALLATILSTFAVSRSLSGQATPPAQNSITVEELVERTQQLYDALPSGNQAPWKLYFADDAMIHDEKGRVQNKSELVADVSPMPVGYKLAFTVVHPHALFAFDTAILAYECDETETVFGHELHARYHTIDTWLLRNGSWEIAASQTMRYYGDPALGTTDEDHLDDLVGTYELSPGNRRTISREAENLFSQRGTEPKTQLFPESGDIFFRKGVEGRILFHRNSSRKIDALYDRRNDEDLIWRRVQ